MIRNDEERRDGRDMIVCNNECNKHEPQHKYSVYRLGGCYCSVCDYYYTDSFAKCPCCRAATRHSSRSNKRMVVEHIRIV